MDKINFRWLIFSNKNLFLKKKTSYNSFFLTFTQITLLSVENAVLNFHAVLNYWFRRYARFCECYSPVFSDFCQTSGDK